MTRQRIIAGCELLGLILAVLIPAVGIRLVLGDPRFSSWSPLIAAPTALLQALIYSTLLVLFARSLRPGRDPLISQVARRFRGDLPGELQAYTRRVTIAWCLFFAAQLAASGLLLAFAPLPVWSRFVMFYNLPLVAAMFGGEYAYRLIRYRHHKHESPVQMIRAYRELRRTGRSR